MESKYYMFLWVIFVLILIIYLYSKNSLSISQSTPTSYSATFTNENPYCLTCSLVDNLPETSFKINLPATKKAFLIGLNYSFPGSACITYDCELNGCIQDVKNIKSLLEKQGYLPNDINMLIDDNSTEMPTKAVIIRELTNLISNMKSGDTCFVWYSGHGSQLLNNSSDGGYNECWCPPDTIASGNYLTDDQLNLIFKLAPSNTTIFVGSDSCHSGTILDLKYIGLNTLENANRSIETIRGRKTITTLNSKFTTNNSVLPNLIMNRDLVTGASLNILSDSNFIETESNIISISGCQDYDTSADAFLSGSAQGAMTWAFLKSFTNTVTLSDLITNMQYLLKTTGFKQIPQISFGKVINPNTTKVIDIICPI